MTPFSFLVSDTERVLTCWRKEDLISRLDSLGLATKPFSAQREQQQQLQPSSACMEAETARNEKKKSSVRRKKKAKIPFEWRKEDELIVLKQVVEFSAQKIPDEEFYPFIRSGLRSQVSKIEIFEKIQELKREYLSGRRGEKEEGFELSERLWGDERGGGGSGSGSGSSSKALEESRGKYFEEYLEGHGVQAEVLAAAQLEATRRELEELWYLQNQQLLNKANLKAQVEQFKHRIMGAGLKNIPTPP